MATLEEGQKVKLNLAQEENEALKERLAEAEENAQKAKNEVV
jgi:predicted DNA-binding antitoxin AbrB/MazE fold protein